MKPHEYENIKSLEPLINSQGNDMSTVKPLPTPEEAGGIDKLLKALPYYILTYGHNIERLGKVIDDKRLSFLLIGLGKAIRWIGNTYYNKKYK